MSAMRMVRTTSPTGIGRSPSGDSAGTTRLRLVALFAAVLGMTGPARAQTIEWVRQFGGLGPVGDYANGTDGDGNVYVVGSTGGFLPGQTSAGDRDAFVRKYNAAGSEVWTRQFGTASNDAARAIAVDATGLYVAGWAGATLPGEVSAGAWDAFVRKYDADGNEVWTRQFGTSGLEQAFAIAMDATGVYVAGITFGTLAGEVSAGASDAFVRKYNAAGSEVWTRQFGTSAYDGALAIALDAAGVYVAGYVGATLPGQVSAGGGDAFVRKYDAAGNEVWTRQFGTSSADDVLAIAADATGVYVGGWTYGALPGQTSAGDYDAFVRQYDADGNEVWTRQFGTSSYDAAFGIAADATGVYVGGRTYGTLSGQASAGADDAFVRKYDRAGNVLWTRQFGTGANDGARGLGANEVCVCVAGYTTGTLPGQTSAGLEDAFVRKYDTDGNEVWTRQFGGAAGTDEVATVDSDGNVYLAGWTGATLPGQTSAGGYDAFVRKYDPTGNEVWTRQFGTSSTDWASAIAVGVTGVYVAGSTDGTLPGQTSAGGLDAFVRKYDAAGNEIWTRQFGTSLSDYGVEIAVGATGVYVTGYTYGTLPGQVSAGAGDAFVRKYDADANEVWTRQFGTSSDDYAYAIAVDATGAYVTGYTGGNPFGAPFVGNPEAFVRKYDVAGNELWTRQFGTPSGAYAYFIAADVTSVYVAGLTFGALPGQVSAGGADAFLRKYDTGGNEAWTRQFGTTSFEVATAIAVDATGLYVAGYTYGTLPGQVSAGGDDAFVRKYDAAGNEIGTLQFGTASSDQAFGVSALGSALYVAGWTSGVFPGQTSAGGYDVFLVKLRVEVPNEPPVCNTGGPYSSECRTSAIDAATASDPDGDELTYTWTSSNPNVTLSPTAGAIPAGPGVRAVPPSTATLSNQVNPCNVVATLTLTVRDDQNSESFCETTVRFNDTTPPTISECPARITDADGNCQAAVPDFTADVVASDTCSAREALIVTQDVPASMLVGLGPHAIRLTVTDPCGNVSTCETTFTVAATVAGFEEPINATLVRQPQEPALPERAFRQGRTMPLKLRLFCGGQPLTNVPPPRIVAILREGNAIPLETIDPDPGQANDNGWLFRAADDRWMYNLSTHDLSTGTYRITVEMPDGLRYDAAFVLR